MRNMLRSSFAALTIFTVMTFGLILAGCGGGSGGVSSAVVSGTAAVGAPLSGQVTLKDSSTPMQQRSAIIGAGGSFAIDVTGMKAPYVLQAIGSFEDTEYKLHSFADGAGTANINPLSDVIVASAAGVDDPSDVFDKIDSDKCDKIRKNLAQTVSITLTKLQPLLKHYNAEDTNPITSRFIANHLGLDGMFDNVTITVSNGTLSIVSKKDGAVIFTGKISDIANGTFDVSALPPAAPAPAAPTGLTAVGGTGQVTLSWASVSNTTSYNVYYAATSGVTTTSGTKITSVSAPYVQTGLTAGTTYFYVVTAVNSSGESAASAQAAAGTASAPPEPTVPAAAASVTATGGTNQVTISWNAVNSATSYNVYYATTSGVTKTNGTKISNATSPTVQTGLAAGTAYFYIVTAVNNVGEGAASTQVAATTLAAVPTPTAPTAPTAVAAVGGANQATITWPAVSGAASYNLYWSTTSGVTKTSGTKVAAVSSPYVKTGLSAGTTYYFVVTAANSVGESAASTQATATTNAPQLAAPAAPTGVTPVGGANQMNISWPAVSGATSYNIYYATASGVTKTSGAKITNASSPYIQTGLAASTTYYYIVTAANSAGEGAASTQVSAATSPPPAQTCGSCHAIPPAVGAHAIHSFTSCATCHGTGYSSTTTNAATHMNGTNDVSISIWNATTRTCASSCHGSRAW
jgi:predicted phage tail protein